MNNLTYFLLLFLSSVLFSDCSKKFPGSHLLELPPITMEGSNVVACYINGKMYILEGKDESVGFSFGPIRGNRVRYNVSSSSVRITSRKPKPDEVDLTITFKLEEGKYIYELNELGSSSARITVGIDNNIFTEPEYKTNAQYKGHVELLMFRHGEPNGINFVAGTFAFDAINAEGDVIEVREGRFDISF